MINFRTDGRIALVTGSSRGIGKAIAIALAESGADIIGVSSKPEPGSDVEKEVVKAGKKFFNYQCDLSDRKSLYSFIEKVKTDHPRIDILVNNAGHILRKPVAEHPDDYWDTIHRYSKSCPFIGKCFQERGNSAFACCISWYINASLERKQGTGEYDLSISLLDHSFADLTC